MRIAIDARMMIERPTGIGTYTCNLIKYLSVIDKTNDYIILVNDRKLIDALGLRGNFRVKQIRCKPMSITEQFAMPWLFIKERIDLFHATSFVVPRILTTKAIITVHDLTHVKFKKEFSAIVQFYYKYIVKPVAKKASAVLTISESSKNDILNWINIESQRVKITLLAAEKYFKQISDKNDLNEIKNKYNIRKMFILYNGNKKAHKNVESLIEAFYILRTKMGVDCNLVIVGKRDNSVSETNYSKLENIINERKLQNEIVYTGCATIEDIVLLYNAAAVFVFPSLYEGFGLPPLEAMSCGCPVVVSKVASLPDVCGDAAYYIDPYKIDSIADGIYKVLADEPLRKSLIAKGLERAKVFSWEKCARETLEIYKEALDL